MKPAAAPVSVMEFVVPLVPPETMKFPVAPVVRPASEPKFKVVDVTPEVNVDCTVPSPPRKESAPMFWVTVPADAELKLNVPPPAFAAPKVSAGLVALVKVVPAVTTIEPPLMVIAPELA